LTLRSILSIISSSVCVRSSDQLSVGPQENNMTESLQELLLELEQFGSSNDGTITDRPRRMLNITRDTGEFLSVLVRAMNAQRVLEIGTSNGYSTLWLALAAKAIDGHVTTVELSDFKLTLAAKNFERSGLASFITQVNGEAGTVLRSNPESSFDIIFLDSERSEYLGWWPEIKRVIRKGGLIVVDNATSHSAEMAPFMALVSVDPEFVTCTVPVGNGEFLATRASL
jgi:predicted O-methyltransferase YrrM